MKRTDDLAIQIQQGRKDLILELWEAVNPYVKKLANRYCALAGGCLPGGVEVADLVQCGYFAMVDALKTFDSSKAGFITYLTWYLRKQFQAAMGGQRREPLNHCISLDVPANAADPDGETLLELMPDPYDVFSGPEERIYQEQLHKALDDALNMIPEAEACAIRAEYYEGRKQKEIAAMLGVSQEWARQLRNGGFRHIRKGSARAVLERFLDLETPFYRNVSIERFNTTHTSAVEAAMLYRDRRRAELLKNIKKAPEGK